MLPRIVTFNRDVHPEKAVIPILVTLLGIVIFFNDVHPLNKSAPNYILW